MAKRKPSKWAPDPSPSERTHWLNHRTKGGPSPSTSVLALLAAVAPQASSTPLDFLYPTLQLREATTTTTTSTKETQIRANVPAKYVVGSDGQWRQAETVSLYGSTVCTANCPALELAAATSSASVSAHPSVNTSNLPLGWAVGKPGSMEHTTLIIALSLGLASFIVFCMIGCLFVRKTRRRRKYGLEDIEGKAGQRRRKRRSKVQDETLVEKNTARSWVKASARWKDGALRAARRRRSIYRWRGASSVSVSSPAHSPDAPSEIRSHSSSVHSRPSMTDGIDTSPESQIDLVPPDSRRSSISPPAYPSPYTPTSSGKTRLLHPAQSSSNMSSLYEHSNSSAENSSSFVSPASGHIATDDKAALAQLAAMASAPTVSGHGQDASSAPEWDDDQYESIYAGPSSAHGERIPLSPPPQPASFLPSPPEKPHSFEDPLSDEAYEIDTFNVVPLHLEDNVLQPSAPPFEEHLSPSAPPAIDLDGFEEGEERLSHPSHEEEPGQNHDRQQPPTYPS
ncbi:hypothetical protein DL96DRAFT_1574863 [Flagelloscypha sp. PMI_526]|nr:hypothetical protein DL96DRAFT_1574863 [Flagelloscypha sp. PMI_526]